jgi:prepilin-type N-terminal cleavage/methylation domain-containing protein
MKHITKNTKSEKDNRALKKSAPCPKGFSLLEMIIAIFIFSVIILTSVSIFAKIFSVRGKTRSIQMNMESGRVALENIAKNMRMSSGLKVNGSDQDIYMYNNSQSQCVEYKFSGSALQAAQANPSDPDNPDCAPGAVAYTFYPIVTGMAGVTGRFLITSTDISGKVIGKASVILMINGGNNIQTSVSFRDYQGIIQ